MDLLSQPDWSFVDPLGMTGLCDSLSRTVLACHSIRFSRFRRGRHWLVNLRFCQPRATEASLGGEEILYALTSTLSTTLFEVSRPDFRVASGGRKRPRLMLLEGDVDR